MTDQRTPIVDAYHHFRDPRVERQPRLCDEPPLAFRYGDCRALREAFLLSDRGGILDAGARP